MRRSRQLSLVTALGLPAWSAGPTGDDDLFAAAADAGYEGMQVFVPAQGRKARDAGMTEVSGIAAARSAREIEDSLAMWAGHGATSVTLHLGSGFESAAEATTLVETALDASGRHDVPILVETHRATLTQDPARAIHLAAEFPELRFTADVSHWYTGVEMVYGDIDAKLDAIAPVLARGRMIHGRISDPGCIQVAVQPDDESEHVSHFRRMWEMVLAGCTADGVDQLPFVIELLPAGAHYARTVDRGEGPEEEVDRWTQADVLWKIFESLEVPA